MTGGEWIMVALAWAGAVVAWAPIVLTWIDGRRGEVDE